MEISDHRAAVKSRLRSIFRKLNVLSRTEAITVAGRARTHSALVSSILSFCEQRLVQKQENEIGRRLEEVASLHALLV
jgi:hypothetical protein